MELHHFDDPYLRYRALLRLGKIWYHTKSLKLEKFCVKTIQDHSVP